VPLLDEYAARLTEAINAVARDEADAINRAAAVLADQLRGDGLVYLYGPGTHSAIAVQDVFYRAGCPANVVPVSDTTTQVWRSTYTPDADTHNAHVAAHFRRRIPAL
jgi:uncharacterized phosphosugar-binding protein